MLKLLYLALSAKAQIVSLGKISPMPLHLKLHVGSDPVRLCSMAPTTSCGIPSWKLWALACIAYGWYREECSIGILILCTFKFGQALWYDNLSSLWILLLITWTTGMWEIWCNASGPSELWLFQSISCDEAPNWHCSGSTSNPPHGGGPSSACCSCTSPDVVLEN